MALFQYLLLVNITGALPTELKEEIMARRIIQRNVDAEKMTLQEAFQLYKEEKLTINLSSVSTKGYGETFSYFMKHHNFDDTTTFDAINEFTIQHWTADLLEKGLKPASVNRYLRDMRAFFRWCIANNYLDIPDFKVAMVKGQEEPIKAFPESDLLLILEKPNNLDDFVAWRTWTIINWILATGNRASTVCEVKIGDIDFTYKEISLRHTKNKKAQVIPLSSTLETIIKHYIRTWRSNATSNDYLFPSIGNEQLTPNALKHSFNKYCKRRGSSHTNIHGLRHSFALNWIRNGGNEFKLQKILGHSTLEMTRRYVALATDDLKEDFDRFSTLDNLHKSRKPKKTIVQNN